MPELQKTEMAESNITMVAGESRITPQQVRAVKSLLDSGATIPFIARYRKEMTGSLDEVVIGQVRESLERLAALEARRQTVLKSLEEQGVLDAGLRRAVESATTLPALEDLYLPHRPKRRTRATIAREKGLEPLARLILEQRKADPDQEARAFVNAEKGVGSVEDALAGARDVIAEWVSEDAAVRQTMRRLFYSEGTIQSNAVKGKEKEGTNYRDYFDWQEPFSRVPGHRILAMLRGENEGFLRLKIRPPEERALSLLSRHFVRGTGPASTQVALAAEDSYRRLLASSIETDIRQSARERAEEEALRVFGLNLHETLMGPPLGPRAVLAIDPGHRTGCKVVCLDRQGMLLASAVIFVDQSPAQTRVAEATLVDLVRKFNVEAVAIGNGTAGRETEDFVRGLNLGEAIPVVMVNESGASVYSASAVAREEFPSEDITVRGAISIGRRLQDPLAELVKIDPKSIGVGQYQHDVDQGRLKDKLDETVMSCVNRVGVKVNTASQQLLTYVSGLGPALAKNIVAYRKENGPFGSRAQLLKVPRLGPKAFELASGFLRIDGASNPLDGSAVHPESYHIVDRMARNLGCAVADLIQSEVLRRRINLEEYAGEGLGLPTLKDIMEELARPGRDPRRQFDAVAFRADVRTIDKLTPGMRLNGTVTNVTSFGAFVDIGVHQDGLVHISQLSDGFVKNASDVVRVNQRVSVVVLGVDVERKRISLSMKSDQEPFSSAS
jgi:protein Tex